MNSILSQEGALNSAEAGARLILDYLNQIKETGAVPDPRAFFKENTVMEDIMSLANLTAIAGAMAQSAMEVGNIVPVTIEPITGMVS